MRARHVRRLRPAGVAGAVTAAFVAFTTSGCPAADDGPTANTDAATGVSAGSGSATSEAGSGGESTDGGGSTAAATASSTGDVADVGDSTTGAPGSTSSGPPVDPPPPLLCSLEAVDPTADPTMAVDAGENPGQLPVVIGEALVRNCGCHYTDEVEPPHVDYLSNTVLLATHADFHVEFTGTFPQDFEGMPVYLAVHERVVNQLPLPMPSIMCGVEGESGVITAADRDLFEDWLNAGAPDGANYPPR